MQELSVARLRDVLDFDPGTGAFTRRVKLAQRHAVGDRADTVWESNRGYRRVALDGRRYLAHRLAWFHFYGSLPSAGMDIDHINGCKGDNRITNLRLVSRRVNLENLRAAKSHSRSGFLGVVPMPNGKWRARIRLKGKAADLGVFVCPEAAHNAYLRAKRVLHEGCSI